MHDYNSGLDMESFTVTANFAVNGTAAGDNLASMFRQTAQGVWELKLDQTLVQQGERQLPVSVRDRQGNRKRIERRFSVSPQTAEKTSH